MERSYGIAVPRRVIVLIAFLLLERKKLRFARAVQSQLSGILINAQEAERSDSPRNYMIDFSQRLALLALGLGTAARSSPSHPRKRTVNCKSFRTMPAI